MGRRKSGTANADSKGKEGKQGTSGVSALKMQMSPTLSDPKTEPANPPSQEERRTRRGRKRLHPPQLVASGKKRGIKKKETLELNGWGLYNREANFLVDHFFRRKTDVINQLEKDTKLPWNLIKQGGKYKPVRVTISINDTLN